MNAWPFDSLCLAAAVSEAQRLAGNRVARVRIKDDRTWVIEFGGKDGRALMLRTAPDYPCLCLFDRAHGARPVRGFAYQLDLHLRGAVLEDVEQIGFDRMLRLSFARSGESRRLYACLFGTHAAAALCDEQDRVLVAERRPELFPIGRNIQLPTPNLDTLEEALAMPDQVGSAPFRLAAGRSPEAVRHASKGVEGWLHSSGPYPVRLTDGAQKFPTFSSAVVAWLCVREDAQAEAHRERMRAALLRQLAALSAARKQLEAKIEAGDRARELQKKGELLLAFHSQVPPKSDRVVLPDEAGNSVEIRLVPELSAVENAERYFAKAKRARSARPLIEQRIRDIEEQMERLRRSLDRTDVPPSNEAESKQTVGRWEGHRIREYDGPSGYSILVGLNASANDFLTRRLAKPNDWWLHARGAAGAHVLIPTGNRPERVPKETIEYAARVAARHSSQKHAKTVPVAYTLAKYVRRPKKAAPGAVVLTHEKVIFVEPLPFDQ
jgi:predicted ribosome quality control (RQC) complex YloA/Tae2 family protein